jgi:8-oxo-dGTP pyrophosphatase MutT (NUDIX family)
MLKEFERIDADLPIGINALILNDKGELLLSKRGKNSFCGGMRGLPGGHLEKEEPLEEGVARECKEELNITVNPNNIYIINL